MPNRVITPPPGPDLCDISDFWVGDIGITQPEQPDPANPASMNPNSRLREGTVIMRSYGEFLSLNNPGDTWGECLEGIPMKRLPVGSEITILVGICQEDEL